MPLRYYFVCPLENGLHARPANHLADAVAKFQSAISLTNDRTGMSADAGSVLELVAAGVLHQDTCWLDIDGGDEEEAYTALRAFVETVLPTCDTPLVPVPVKAHELPPGLRGAAVQFQAGVPLSPGIGIGPVVVLGATRLLAAIEPAGEVAPAEEQMQLATALAAVGASLEAQLMAVTDPTAADVLRATIAIAADAAFAAALQDRIAAGCSGAQAVVQTIEGFSSRLAASGSAYLRERIVDLNDIGLELLDQLGAGQTTPAPRLAGPSLVAAYSMAPRQLLALDRSLLRGLILAEAGQTSHVAILARSFRIPAVTGVQVPLGQLDGSLAVLDADRGVVVLDPDRATKRFYEREASFATRRSRNMAVAQPPAPPPGSSAMHVGANIAIAEEAALAFASGADGIGLFRTEMLFADRSAAPSEDEQLGAYRQVLAAAAGRPVIIRTLDIGGDKPLAYLPHLPEANPFLGTRGIRLYAAQSALLDTQLRAILRASAAGPVKVMAPMVTTVAEAEWFRQRLDEVQAELRAADIPFDSGLQIGVMIETPAAAMSIAQLAPVCDFFSIGTNDLCQYFMAADRCNPALASLQDELSPAFLRLLRLTVDDAKARGKWIGLCGEMAGKPDQLPLLVGLGLDEISLAAPGIAAAKVRAAQSDGAACRSLLDKAIAARDAAEVTALLHSLPTVSGAQPLVEDSLIVLDSDSRDKTEVLHELANLLWAAGRTEAPDAIEAALWAREQAYATGMGYGFAIPHCRTDAVRASSLVVLRLLQSVPWGGADNPPVQHVLFIAISATDPADAHLRVFAKLARRLMDDVFRASLVGASTPNAILGLLNRELELDPAKE